MEKRDLAAMLLVLEHRVQDLQGEIHDLFQRVLDSIEDDDVGL